MNNKTLGLIIILVSLVLGTLLFTFEREINKQNDASCSCTEMQNGGTCPHQQKNYWQTYAGLSLLAALIALGIYLIFFEKSQKEIISTLEKQKQVQNEDERFNILLKGLSEEEKSIIKAVKEQDGITQQTLGIRVNMHKSKLSIVLSDLEKKGLIVRKDKGKTKQVFIKIAL